MDTPAAPAVGGGLDMLGGLTAAPAAADPFGLGGGMGMASPAAAPVLLAQDKGNGLQISGQLQRENGGAVYSLEFTNFSAMPLNGFMIQFNKNSFGLTPQGALQVPPLAPGGGAGATKLPVAFNPQQVSPGAFNPQLQVAIKNVTSGSVSYFTDTVPLAAVATEDGNLERNTFLQTWQSLPEAMEQKQQIGASVASAEALAQKLAGGNVFMVAQQSSPMGKSLMYCTCKVAPFNAQLLVEVAWAPGTPGATVTVKSQRPDLAPLAFQAVQRAA